MAASAQKAEIDVVEEHRRIDSALDAGLPHAARAARLHAA
jgi:DNA-binding FadR family transcriptional regulator